MVLNEYVKKGSDECSRLGKAFQGNGCRCEVYLGEMVGLYQPWYLHEVRELR